MKKEWYRYTGPYGARVRDLFEYDYDYAGNRLSRTIYTGLDPDGDFAEAYAYDNLQRLVTFDRGNLGGTPDQEEDWTLDQMGNWAALVNKTSGSTVLDQARVHNDVNEIDVDNDHTNAAGASITATTGANWVDPEYDAAGNMIRGPKCSAVNDDDDFTYDAWNRLAYEDQGRYLMEYDGLHRRISRDHDGATEVRDYFYNEQWQLIEERKDGDADPLAQYVWHPHYIDALAVRYYDADVDGNLAENNDGKHYFLQDANFNVTAVINDADTVLERYAYTPYGAPIVLDADFSADADNESDIDNEHLYTGRQRDLLSGLQLNRNRYYHAYLGRWMNRDPIGYEGSAWNLYEYAVTSPLSRSDPMGLLGVPPLPFDVHDADYPPGREQLCASLNRRIINVQRRIKKRIEDIKNNPQRLPSTHPDDKQHPSLSVRGHWRLISEDKATLAQLMAEFTARCRPPFEPEPVKEPVPSPQPTRPGSGYRFDIFEYPELSTPWGSMPIPPPIFSRPCGGGVPSHHPMLMF